METDKTRKKHKTGRITWKLRQYQSTFPNGMLNTYKLFQNQKTNESFQKILYYQSKSVCFVVYLFQGMCMLCSYTLWNIVAMLQIG